MQTPFIFINLLATPEGVNYHFNKFFSRIKYKSIVLMYSPNTFKLELKFNHRTNLF